MSQRNPFLIVALLVLLVPFAMATDKATFRFYINQTANASFNHSEQVLCSPANVSINRTVNFFSTQAVPFHLNDTVELGATGHLYYYNTTGFWFSLELPSNRDRWYSFNVPNLTEQARSLNVSFSSDFIEPELVIINCSPQIFTPVRVYVQGNHTIQLPFYLNFSSLNLTNITLTEGYPVELRFWLPGLNQSYTKTLRFWDVTAPQFTEFEFFKQMRVGELERVRLIYTDYSALGAANCTSSLPATVKAVLKPSYVDVLVTPQRYGTLTLNCTLTDLFNNSAFFSKTYIVTPLGTLALANIEIPRLRQGKQFTKTLYSGPMP
ncbi:MAG: hypothetical protein DRP42_03750, partial [Tenericutes bacterium]